MKLHDEYAFDAPIETVWEHIFADGALASLIPGAEKLVRVSQDEYEAVIPVHMLLFKSQLKAHLRILEKEKPDFCRFKADFAGKLGSGMMKGELRFKDMGKKTRVKYEADIDLAGTLAGPGARIIENSGPEKVRQSLDRINADLQR